jgi:death-on-curing protein
MNRSIQYPTLRHVLDIHREIMKLSDGEIGILNSGNLEFALDYIQDQPFTISINDLFTKCAILGRAIIQGHPFVDGNKRTGIEVIDVFLGRNGFDLQVGVNEGVQFAINVAIESLSLKEMRDWIEDHSKKDINKKLSVRERRVTYMNDESLDRTTRKRDNPYNISEEMMALIDASIKKNKKLLEELSKY